MRSKEYLLRASIWIWIKQLNRVGMSGSHLLNLKDHKQRTILYHNSRIPFQDPIRWNLGYPYIREEMHVYLLDFI